MCARGCTKSAAVPVCWRHTCRGSLAWNEPLQSLCSGPRAQRQGWECNTGKAAIKRSLARDRALLPGVAATAAWGPWAERYSSTPLHTRTSSCRQPPTNPHIMLLLLHILFYTVLYCNIPFYRHKYMLCDTQIQWTQPEMSWSWGLTWTDNTCTVHTQCLHLYHRGFTQCMHITNTHYT